MFYGSLPHDLRRDGKGAHAVPCERCGVHSELSSSADRCDVAECRASALHDVCCTNVGDRHGVMSRTHSTEAIRSPKPEQIGSGCCVSPVAVTRPQCSTVSHDPNDAVSYHADSTRTTNVKSNRTHETCKPGSLAMDQEVEEALLQQQQQEQQQPCTDVMCASRETGVLDSRRGVGRDTHSDKDTLCSSTSSNVAMCLADAIDAVTHSSNRFPSVSGQTTSTAWSPRAKDHRRAGTETIHSTTATSSPWFVQHAFTPVLSAHPTPPQSPPPPTARVAGQLVREVSARSLVMSALHQHDVPEPSMSAYGTRHDNSSNKNSDNNYRSADTHRARAIFDTSEASGRSNGHTIRGYNAERLPESTIGGSTNELTVAVEEAAGELGLEEQSAPSPVVLAHRTSATSGSLPRLSFKDRQRFSLSHRSPCLSQSASCTSLTLTSGGASAVRATGRGGGLLDRHGSSSSSSVRTSLHASPVFRLQSRCARCSGDKSPLLCPPTPTPPRLARSMSDGTLAQSDKPHRYSGVIAAGSKNSSSSQSSVGDHKTTTINNSGRDEDAALLPRSPHARGSPSSSSLSGARFGAGDWASPNSSERGVDLLLDHASSSPPHDPPPSPHGHRSSEVVCNSSPRATSSAYGQKQQPQQQSINHSSPVPRSSLVTFTSDTVFNSDSTALRRSSSPSCCPAQTCAREQRRASDTRFDRARARRCSLEDTPKPSPITALSSSSLVAAKSTPLAIESAFAITTTSTPSISYSSPMLLSASASVSVTPWISGLNARTLLARGTCATNTSDSLPCVPVDASSCDDRHDNNTSDGRGSSNKSNTVDGEAEGCAANSAQRAAAAAAAAAQTEGAHADSEDARRAEDAAESAMWRGISFMACASPAVSSSSTAAAPATTDSAASPIPRRASTPHLQRAACSALSHRRAHQAANPVSTAPPIATAMSANISTDPNRTTCSATPHGNTERADFSPAAQGQTWSRDAPAHCLCHAHHYRVNASTNEPLVSLRLPASVTITRDPVHYASLSASDRSAARFGRAAAAVAGSDGMRSAFMAPHALPQQQHRSDTPPQQDDRGGGGERGGRIDMHIKCSSHQRSDDATPAHAGSANSNSNDNNNTNKDNVMQAGKCDLSGLGWGEGHRTSDPRLAAPNRRRRHRGKMLRPDVISLQASSSTIGDERAFSLPLPRVQETMDDSPLGPQSNNAPRLTDSQGNADDSSSSRGNDHGENARTHGTMHGDKSHAGKPRSCKDNTSNADASAVHGDGSCNCEKDSSHNNQQSTEARCAEMPTARRTCVAATKESGRVSSFSSLQFVARRRGAYRREPRNRTHCRHSSSAAATPKLAPTVSPTSTESRSLRRREHRKAHMFSQIYLGMASTMHCPHPLHARSHPTHSCSHHPHYHDHHHHHARHGINNNNNNDPQQLQRRHHRWSSYGMHEPQQQHKLHVPHDGNESICSKGDNFDNTVDSMGSDTCDDDEDRNNTTGCTERRPGLQHTQSGPWTISDEGENACSRCAVSWLPGNHANKVPAAADDYGGLLSTLYSSSALHECGCSSPGMTESVEHIFIPVYELASNTSAADSVCVNADVSDGAAVGGGGGTHDAPPSQSRGPRCSVHHTPDAAAGGKHTALIGSIGSDGSRHTNRDAHHTDEEGGVGVMRAEGGSGGCPSHTAEQSCVGGGLLPHAADGTHSGETDKARNVPDAHAMSSQAPHTKPSPCQEHQSSHVDTDAECNNKSSRRSGIDSNCGSNTRHGNGEEYDGAAGANRADHEWEHANHGDSDTPKDSTLDGACLGRSISASCASPAAPSPFAGGTRAVSPDTLHGTHTAQTTAQAHSLCSYLLHAPLPLPTQRYRSHWGRIAAHYNVDPADEPDPLVDCKIAARLLFTRALSHRRSTADSSDTTEAARSAPATFCSPRRRSSCVNACRHHRSRTSDSSRSAMRCTCPGATSEAGAAEHGCANHAATANGVPTDDEDEKQGMHNGDDDSEDETDGGVYVIDPMREVERYVDRTTSLRGGSVVGAMYGTAELAVMPSPNSCDELSGVWRGLRRSPNHASRRNDSHSATGTDDGGRGCGGDHTTGDSHKHRSIAVGSEDAANDARSAGNEEEEEEEDGSCGCSESVIGKDYRGIDYSSYRAHDLYRRCAHCQRTPATFLCLHCLQAVCPSHVTRHHRHNSECCTLFLNLLDVTTSFKRVFWCELCRQFTWRFTEIYDALVDQIAYTRGTYWKSPVRDIHCVCYEAHLSHPCLYPRSCSLCGDKDPDNLLHNSHSNNNHDHNHTSDCPDVHAHTHDVAADALCESRVDARRRSQSGVVCNASSHGVADSPQRIGCTNCTPLMHTTYPNKGNTDNDTDGATPSRTRRDSQPRHPRPVRGTTPAHRSGSRIHTTPIASPTAPSASLSSVSSFAAAARDDGAVAAQATSSRASANRAANAHAHAHAAAAPAELVSTEAANMHANITYTSTNIRMSASPVAASTLVPIANASTRMRVCASPTVAGRYMDANSSTVFSPTSLSSPILTRTLSGHRGSADAGLSPTLPSPMFAMLHRDVQNLCRGTNVIPVGSAVTKLCAMGARVQGWRSAQEDAETAFMVYLPALGQGDTAHAGTTITATAAASDSSNNPDLDTLSDATARIAATYYAAESKELLCRDCISQDKQSPSHNPLGNSSNNNDNNNARHVENELSCMSLSVSTSSPHPARIPMAVYCVFDGHGGDAVAKLAAKHFEEHLCAAIAQSRENDGRARALLFHVASESLHASVDTALNSTRSRKMMHCSSTTTTTTNTTIPATNARRSVDVTTAYDAMSDIMHLPSSTYDTDVRNANHHNSDRDSAVDHEDEDVRDGRAALREAQHTWVSDQMSCVTAATGAMPTPCQLPMSLAHVVAHHTHAGEEHDEVDELRKQPSKHHLRQDGYDDDDVAPQQEQQHEQQSGREQRLPGTVYALLSADNRSPTTTQQTANVSSPVAGVATPPRTPRPPDVDSMGLTLPPLCASLWPLSSPDAVSGEEGGGMLLPCGRQTAAPAAPASAEEAVLHYSMSRTGLWDAQSGTIRRGNTSSTSEEEENRCSHRKGEWWDAFAPAHETAPTMHASLTGDNKEDNTPHRTTIHSEPHTMDVNTVYSSKDTMHNDDNNSHSNDDDNNGCAIHNYMSNSMSSNGGTLVTKSEMEMLRRYFASIITDALVALDDFLQHTAEGERGDYGRVGCTACIVGITRNFILCANVGDSGAALYTTHEMRMISVAHRLQNAHEQTRIRRAGYAIVDDRIEGLLAVPRALGDFEFKQCGSCSVHQQAVSVMPDVTIQPVPSNQAEWGVIVACDGVWDTMTCHQLHYALTHAEEDVCAAQSAREAVQRGRRKMQRRTQQRGVHMWAAPRDRMHMGPPPSPHEQALRCDDDAGDAEKVPMTADVATEAERNEAVMEQATLRESENSDGNEQRRPGPEMAHHAHVNGNRNPHNDVKDSTQRNNSSTEGKNDNSQVDPRDNSNGAVAGGVAAATATPEALTHAFASSDAAILEAASRGQAVHAHDPWPHTRSGSPRMTRLHADVEDVVGMGRCGIDPHLLTVAAGVFAQCVAPADNEEGIGLDNCSLIIIENRVM